MRRQSAPHEFLNTDPEAIDMALISLYEEITGETVTPASPVRLFISWITDALAQVMAMINYAANQNIPSQAVGSNLDALGELYFGKKRPQAMAATVTMRFTLSAAQNTSVLIPRGTRVAVNNADIVFVTQNDTYVPIGATTIDIRAICHTVGEVGNGYLPGQIAELVDPFPYYLSCSNITTSDGGTNKATDDEYYELMVQSRDAISTAGSVGAYIYWTKSVSTNIRDVVVNSPSAGEVRIYIVMHDGKKANEEIKSAVQRATSSEMIRPLTDHVEVADPNEAQYDINITYYLDRRAQVSASETETHISDAVNSYIAWQAEKLGRDINPAKLISLVMAVPGIKRVEVTSPVFAVLKDGSDGSAPDLAAIRGKTVINGGYEDE